MSRRQIGIILIIFCTTSFLFSACKKSNPTTGVTPVIPLVSPTPSSSPEPSQTPLPPTSTPVPLAVVINGETITLAEFQAELKRFEATIPISGTNLASDSKTTVINELIDQTLLAQSAGLNGYTVDDTLLQTRIKALESALGSIQALEDWKTAHGYSEADFVQSLRRSIGAAWMRDQIINGLPESAEQVHVLQILLPTKAEADQVYDSLQSGEDFLVLAAKYDPLTKGELGWFPRSYLDEPAIEEAAFALQPGEYSPVVETEVGFHILYLVERDSNRMLQPDARQKLQKQALEDWISERRSQSEIQILVP